MQGHIRVVLYKWVKYRYFVFKLIDYKSWAIPTIPQPSGQGFYHKQAQDVSLAPVLYYTSIS